MIGVSHAQGELLGRVVPVAANTPETLFKAGELRTEITLFIIAQAPLSGNQTAEVVIFHDDTGEDVYDATTAIGISVIDRTAAGGFTTVLQAQHPGSGIHISPGGSIGVQSSRAGETAFTVYGITETRADRIGRR